jgi:hypothetical protein
LAAGFGQRGTAFERCRAEAIIAPRSRGDEADQESTHDAARVAGLSRILFLGGSLISSDCDLAI